MQEIIDERFSGRQRISFFVHGQLIRPDIGHTGMEDGIEVNRPWLAGSGQEQGSVFVFAQGGSLQLWTSFEWIEPVGTISKIKCTQ